MNYIDTYQYTEIYAIELEIPKYCIRFLFIHLIVRKIGISCEVLSYFFIHRPFSTHPNRIYCFLFISK
ncbi:hypothetical protein COM25_10555 [Bacillus wiedmannii]|nr:hypothetical protein CN560_12730 [Bacillus wiedmannii]PGC76035.1 hypothetical protein COM25_10555 [Bacillus wiedmannii]PHF11909.1 hypothetical protein COF84_26395 [Bacillus wiedmannii]